MQINGIPVVVADLETELVRPGWILPRPAIATTHDDANGARLWLTRELEGLWTRLLTDAIAGRIYIAGHDVGRFDLNVTGAHFPHLRGLIRRALQLGRVLDTIQAERIIEIHRHQRGGAGLDDLCRKYGVPFVDKKDEATQAIRLSFGQFIGAEHIPEAHAEYALNDAIVPGVVLERQLQTQLVDLDDLAEFVRRAYNGGRVAARGFRTEPARVEKLGEMIDHKLKDLEAIARDCGFLRTNRDGTISQNKKAIQIAVALDRTGKRLEDVEYTPEDRKSKAAMNRAQTRWVEQLSSHPDVPKTETGRISVGRLELEDSTDPRLQALSEWGQITYVRNKDLKTFRDGALHPVQPRFTIIDTGRYSASKPAVQNLGKLKGVRECIVARPGYGLVISDFKMLELVGLAQLCVDVLGLHTMAEKIRSGIDMHAEIGADVLGCSYDEVVARKAAGDPIASEARDSGKPANFGLNGGMTDPRTFQLYARKSYGQLLTLEQCARIIEAWKGRAVDQQCWLEYVRRTGYTITKVNDATGEVERWTRYDMKHPGFKNLWRRGLSRTEASNNPFQIVGANVSHRALGYVLDAQYDPADDGGPGAMWGSHVVLTTHDDIVSECPLDCISEHAEIQQQLMAQAARELCPGVFNADTPLKRIVDTRVLTHLSKDAPASKDASGRFQITDVQMPTWEAST